MNIYKSKPQIITAIITGLIICFLLKFKIDDIVLNIFRYGFSLLLLYGIVMGLFVPRLTISFSGSEVLIRQNLAPESNIGKTDIIDVNIISKKIYIQSKKENYTIAKNLFDTNQFDAIVNEFLKIKAENQRTFK